jgi:hypothetical protein
VAKAAAKVVRAAKRAMRPADDQGLGLFSLTLFFTCRKEKQYQNDEVAADDTSASPSLTITIGYLHTVDGSSFF